MEGRDKLRHVGHGDLLGGHAADQSADADAADNQGDGQPIGDTGHPQGGGDSQRHTDHAVAVARPAGSRRGQPFQRQNEENAGGEIEKSGDIGVRAHFLSFFLYIASMRAVTRKPPKMFTDAIARAKKPSPLEIQDAWDITGTATAISAPTTITEEIALVTAIRGGGSA